MKTSREFSKKLSQKGAGMLEYALLFGFVVAIFLIVFSEGGFGDAVGNLFGSSGDSVNSVEFDSGSGGGGSGSSSGASLTSYSGSATTSTASESTAAETTAEVTYKPLNWVRDILPFADGTYNTIARSPSVDDAIKSEMGFINTLFTAVEGGLASTNAADGTKDWETFLNMMDSTKTKNNISSSYVRDEQKVTVNKVGKDLRVTYSDKENSVYYKLSPDANNVMQIETNSSKAFSEFFKSTIAGKEKGWSYGN